MKDNRWLKPVVCVITVLLAIGVGAMLYVDDMQMKKQAEWMAHLQEEARPYEEEIQQMQDELDEKHGEANTADVLPEVLLLLQVQDPEEVARAGEWFGAYGLPVTFVLDTAMEDTKQQTVLQAIQENSDFAEAGTDIITCGNPSAEGVMERFERQKELCAGYPLELSAGWFLDANEETKENVEQLLLNGLEGYSQLTDYGTAVKSGTLDDGLVYVEHVPVETGDNKIESTLNLCVEQKKAAALSFDMELLAALDKAEADSLMDTVLALVQTRQDGSSITVHTMGQLLEQNALQKQSEEERQAAYEQFAAEQQEKIDELQDKVNEIYSRWEEWKE